MKKLSIKDLVTFRSKSEKSKKSFVATLQKSKVQTEKGGGGDYWISSLSAFSRSYRDNDASIISKKIEELEEKFAGAKRTITKTMYRRNIEILSHYIGFDLKKWKRLKKLIFLGQSKDNHVITIKGIEMSVAPHRVFFFQNENAEEVGAIWFIAKLGGYQKEELGMFAELLYLYIKVHFSKKYKINPRHCIAVDVVNNRDVSYSQLESGNVQRLLNPTIDELKKML